jgi:hypothetical protein
MSLAARVTRVEQLCEAARHGEREADCTCERIDLGYAAGVNDAVAVLERSLDEVTVSLAGAIARVRELL